jgi:UrcA family protein
MTMPYTRTLSLCVAFALTGAGVVALASPAHGRSRPVIVEAPSTNAISTRVSYADLNLASSQGEGILNRRVGSAVNMVCTETDPGAEMYAYQGCRRFAWNGARPQIARAVQRAREIASTGHSSIAAAAITLTFPK